jgi:hypothetical protein
MMAITMRIERENKDHCKIIASSVQDHCKVSVRSVRGHCKVSAGSVQGIVKFSTNPSIKYLHNEVNDGNHDENRARK